MSLPSPNIPSAQSEPKSKPKEEPEETNAKGPDSTQLVRRGALVPPKIEDENEDEPDPNDLNCEEISENPDSHSTVPLPIGPGSSQSRNFPRRSSVVVIPPMQVCPGDLLVYSKALTHRGNFPGWPTCLKQYRTSTIFAFFVI